MALALTRARWRHTMTAGPAATCYNASKSLCVRTTPPCASVTRLVPCVRPLMTECLVVVCAGMVGAPTTEASHPTLLTTGQGKGSIYLWILRHWLKQAVGKAVVSQESRPSSRGRWMDGDLDLGRRKKRGGGACGFPVDGSGVVPEGRPGLRFQGDSYSPQRRLDQGYPMECTVKRRRGVRVRRRQWSEGPE